MITFIKLLKLINVFCSNKNIPVVMTSSDHTRALDRVAEAVSFLKDEVLDDDVDVDDDILLDFD